MSKLIPLSCMEVDVQDSSPRRAHLMYGSGCPTSSHSHVWKWMSKLIPMYGSGCPSSSQLPDDRTSATNGPGHDPDLPGGGQEGGAARGLARAGAEARRASGSRRRNGDRSIGEVWKTSGKWICPHSSRCSSTSRHAGRPRLRGCRQRGRRAATRSPTGPAPSRGSPRLPSRTPNRSACARPCRLSRGRLQ